MARPEEVDHVYGMVNGIEGFLSGHVMDLSSLTHEDLTCLSRLRPLIWLMPVQTA